MNQAGSSVAEFTLPLVSTIRFTPLVGLLQNDGVGFLNMSFR